jgi:hypothetical protein
MKRNSQFTATDVATWMFVEFNRNRVLFHDVAVTGIRQKFGPEFTHLGQEGRHQIDQDVLREFRAIAKGTIVWISQKNYWRKRTENDKPWSGQP